MEPFEAKLEKIDKVPYPKVPAAAGSGGLHPPRRPGQCLLSRRLRPAQGRQGRSLADEGQSGQEGHRDPGRKLHRQELARGQKGPARAPRKVSPDRPRPRRRRRPGQGPAQVPPGRPLPILARQRRRRLDALRLRRPRHPLQNPPQRGHPRDEGKEAGPAGRLRRHRLRRRKHEHDHRNDGRTTGGQRGGTAGLREARLRPAAPRDGSPDGRARTGAPRPRPRRRWAPARASAADDASRIPGRHRPGRRRQPPGVRRKGRHHRHPERRLRLRHLARSAPRPGTA